MLTLVVPVALSSNRTWSPGVADSRYTVGLVLVTSLQFCVPDGGASVPMSQLPLIAPLQRGASAIEAMFRSMDVLPVLLTRLPVTRGGSGASVNAPNPP